MLIFGLGEWVAATAHRRGLIVAPVLICLTLLALNRQAQRREVLRPPRPAADLDRPAPDARRSCASSTPSTPSSTTRRAPGWPTASATSTSSTSRGRRLGARNRRRPLHHRPGPPVHRLELLRHHHDLHVPVLLGQLVPVPGIRDRGAQRQQGPLRPLRLALAVDPVLAVEHRQGRVDGDHHRHRRARSRQAADPQPGRLPADRHRALRRRHRAPPRVALLVFVAIAVAFLSAGATAVAFPARSPWAASPRPSASCCCWSPARVLAPQTAHFLKVDDLSAGGVSTALSAPPRPRPPRATRPSTRSTPTRPSATRWPCSRCCFRPLPGELRSALGPGRLARGGSRCC